MIAGQNILEILQVDELSFVKTVFSKVLQPKNLLKRGITKDFNDYNSYSASTSDHVFL